MSPSQSTWREKDWRPARSTQKEKNNYFDPTLPLTQKNYFFLASREKSREKKTRRRLRTPGQATHRPPRDSPRVEKYQRRICRCPSRRAQIALILLPWKSKSAATLFIHKARWISWWAKFCPAVPMQRRRQSKISTATIASAFMPDPTFT